MKGIAEVVEHLLYEALGLLVPGALFALAATVAVVPDAWPHMMEFAVAHWIVAGIAAYAVGYVVQGISRRVTSWWDAALVLPMRGAVLLTALISAPTAGRVGAWLRCRKWSLLRRVGWPSAPAVADRLGVSAEQTAPMGGGQVPVDLQALVADRLCARLGVPSGSRFRPEDLRDLAFSALLPERHRLDRFRAASSFTRGTATVVALGGAALLVVLLLPREAGGWPVTAASVSGLLTLIIAYLALMERSAMYDALWSAIIAPQFLIATSRDPLPPVPGATVAMGEARADFLTQSSEPPTLVSNANGTAISAETVPSTSPPSHRDLSKCLEQ